MTVGPRFIPVTGAVKDEERITPPMLKPGERGGHDISAEVRIKSGLRVTGLRSASHEVEVRRSSGATTVRLKEFDARSRA